MLCAGIGSRLHSTRSKILHEICGRPIGYWSVKQAKAVTTEAPIVVVGHQKEEIESSLTELFQNDLRFACQEIPNGTGGAVKAAISMLPKDVTSVLVVYGDAPLLRKESLSQLLELAANSRSPIAMLTSRTADPTGYGRILRDQSQQIVAIVEERDAQASERAINEVNAGVYVFNAEFLRDAITTLKPKPKPKGEYLLTDIVADYVVKKAPQGPVQSALVAYEEMHGVNDRRQLAFAQHALNQRLLEEWMAAGVTFVDPSSTYIEEGVRLSKDTIIYPSVHMRGATQIGEGCVIENGVVIKNTVIERGAHIYPYSVLESSIVGAHAHVGPFARVRPGSTLDEEVKVGNFVEIKCSRLHRGAKVSHLAYVGDADVGEHANIGAGSITCNYDGQNKHRTVIGNNAFIGSNTTLIAPLTIGEGAYVAGGSTVTENVPEKNIAFGRARQVNKTKPT